MAKRKPRVEQAEIVRRFGARLREARISAGLTQAELASRAGVTVAHVWRLEGGGSAPGLDLVERLAIALGLTTSGLIPQGPAPDPVAVSRDRAKELFEVIVKSGTRDTYLVLNPLLACLVESLRRRP